MDQLVPNCAMLLYNPGIMRSLKLVVVCPALLCAASASAQGNYYAFAERAALEALDSPKPSIVEHGANALAALGSVNSIPKIIGAYERFHEHNEHGPGIDDALDKLLSLPSGDVVILRTLKRLHEQHRGDAIDPYLDSHFYSVLTRLGPKPNKDGQR